MINKIMVERVPLLVYYTFDSDVYAVEFNT